MRKGVEVLNTSLNRELNIPEVLWDMPFTVVESQDRDPMPVFKLETDEKTSTGRKNNYKNGKPVEMLIRTPVIPNIIDIGVGNHYLTIGLPGGSGSKLDQLEGMKFSTEKDAYHFLSTFGFSYIVDLGQATRRVEMGGPGLLLRTTKK